MIEGGVTDTGLDWTHDPALRSWVTGANDGETDFPIQNLPFGVFRLKGSSAPFRCGVAIGDQVLDVARVASLCAEPAREAAQACAEPVLNRLMGMGPQAATALRHALCALLREGSEEASGVARNPDVQVGNGGGRASAAELAARRATVAAALTPLVEVELGLPVRIGGFSDFFASVQHATNAGKLFRPDNPLLPNYKYVPVAYNGRANSIQMDPHVRRPRGQVKSPDALAPLYGPCERLDYEVELGVFIGAATQRWQPVPVADACDHVFGITLLNDWSARDIQSWEYQPLGPFLAKSFATNISPWVVTRDALAPFRVPAFARPSGDPKPLPHLLDTRDQQHGGIGIEVDCLLRSAAMREQGVEAMLLSRSDARTLYWTVSQMVAHHTSNGAVLDSGDLLGTGTISGERDGTLGCLLEITRGGKQSVQLPSGESRHFLQDGDEVTMRGRCVREGFQSIGFGECRGVIAAA